MLKEQLYLLLSIFASRADKSKILKYFEEGTQLSIKEILEVICVFWPELDDPLNLEFIFDHIGVERTKNNDLIFELLNGDESLIALVEINPELTVQRYRWIKEYVSSRLGKWQLSIDEVDYKFLFLRSRSIICNEVVSDVMFYKPLFRKLKYLSSSGGATAFYEWVNGILKPLAHVNRRIELNISIYEFEQKNCEDVMQLFGEIYTDVLSAYKSVMYFEVSPYMTYSGCYDVFLKNCLSLDKFPLDTYNNFQSFRYVASEMNPIFAKDPSLNNLFQHQLLKILYENGQNLIKIPLPNLPDELRNVLEGIDSSVTIDDGITSTELLDYSKYMDALGIHSLKEIHTLKNSNEPNQLSSFMSMSKYLLSSSPSIETLQYLISSDKLYPSLSKDKQMSAIIESLLSLGEFSILHEFISKAGFQIDDSVLLKYFWRFFNGATNGSRNRPEMIKAKNTLSLLPAGKYMHLEVLMDVADKLSEYSLNYSRNVPFTPSHLLEFKQDPLRIISKLLELNPSLYLNFDLTSTIMRKLYVGLEIPCEDPNYEKELTRLTVQHIDCALVNMDLQYAYEKTMELFDKHGDISKYWLTIFQVGKFMDPTWPDNEIPTEIIYLQLEILSKLLHICPFEEVEAVVSLWSGLELELSTRSHVDDPYSLSNNKANKKLQKEIVRQVSSSVSNFLSGGIKWAIGDDMNSG
ncbi:Sec39p Ecym_1158 [Eremothecium cymbalariae DBVPG|uniref:Sec39 domain-containing protein n=1 Tax=Eremothecium cymbalariae (strain CBS 270.75 / DBVPG 7215 / KCTC 17166 / NRRL Y-17582) TaxID=931890 RepID=G8JMQ4_ERECY|nr:hypothetical protein Ecym_1158 [Eremothecium cymbalariae DBVPG\